MESMFVKESFVKFSVSGKYMDGKLKERIPIYQRNCRVEDETEGILYADEYTESNC